MSKFINKNYAFQKSQKQHQNHSMLSSTYTNALMCDYHKAVYSWQKKNKIIMPKKMRMKYYDKYVFSKSK